MINSEFRKCLTVLNLKQRDAAAHLRVTTRAVRRWQNGEHKVPGAIAELLTVWVQLQAAKLPWGADLESIWYGDDEQIRLHQEHDKALGTILSRVKSRGGRPDLWRVNLKKHHATLGHMTVSFYKLASGSFSLAHYRCGEGEPNPRRDQALIEDAVAAFAAAVGKARAERPGHSWDE